MNQFRKLTLLLLMMIFLSALNAQERAAFSYISPVPGSKFINPEQVITFRSPVKIDQSSLYRGWIQVQGSKSGVIEGENDLIGDGHIVTFAPADGFSYGETIHVTVGKGVNDAEGRMFEPMEFTFSVSGSDNLPLLIDYYNSGQNNLLNNKIIGIKSGNYYLNGYNNNRDDNLPPDFVQPVIVNNGNASEGYFFTSSGSLPGAPLYHVYLSIHDNFGTPVFFKKTHPYVGIDLKILPDGRLTYARYIPGNPTYSKYMILNSKYEEVDSVWMGNGYHVDPHDMKMMENGHYLMFSYDPQLVDMSQVVPGGDTNAVVIGLVIQEVDLEQNVYFQWRSWDHFEITDATHDIDLTSDRIDYAHGNAMDFDYDGNILLSSRNMDEITKIKYPEGDIIWRFGLGAKNNMFTFTNDTVGFSHQHDIRSLGNGHYTLYDNGNLHFPPHSRPIEYMLDEDNMTATLEWTFIHDSAIFAPMTGGYLQLENGGNLICWGGLVFTSVAVTELTADEEIAVEFYYPPGATGYRAFKGIWNPTAITVNEDTVDWGNYTGTSPDPRTITIINNTDEPLDITGIHNHLEEFTAEVTLPMTVEANGSVEMTVNFFPTATGEFEDVFTIISDNADTSMRITKQIHLRGTVGASIGEKGKNGIAIAYPNPTSGKFFIEVREYNLVKVEIINTVGEVVTEIETPSEKRVEIDLGNMPSGVYFARLLTEQGHISNLRLVKE